MSPRLAWASMRKRSIATCATMSKQGPSSLSRPAFSACLLSPVCLLQQHNQALQQKGALHRETRGCRNSVAGLSSTAYLCLTTAISGSALPEHGVCPAPHSDTTAMNGTPWRATTEKHASSSSCHPLPNLTSPLPCPHLTSSTSPA
eukprot:746328-Pelagomonas_calceolata.AAC.2